MSRAERVEEAITDKPDDRAIPVDDPEIIRRKEDVPRRHGIDPPHAIEHRDWSERRTD